MFRDIAGSVAVANNLVYFVSRDGYLYTIRHGTREIPGQYQLKWLWMQFWLWGLPVPPPRPQAGAAWRSSPKYRWRGFKFAPAVTPEALYVGDRIGFFYARSAIDGSSLWDLWVGSPASAAPLALGETVYFATEDGSLKALSRKEGQLLWNLRLSAPVIVGPVYGADLLFVRTKDGGIHAIE
jgi:outer membrane protein assembly factor BamB